MEEIALVTCVLRRWDGARLWWPNNLLDSNPLINLSRSNNKWEDCEVHLLSLIDILPAFNENQRDGKFKSVCPHAQIKNRQLCCCCCMRRPLLDTHVLV